MKLVSIAGTPECTGGHFGPSVFFYYIKQNRPAFAARFVLKEEKDQVRLHLRETKPGIYTEAKT